MRKLKITQIKSTIGSTERKKLTIKALGLRKIGGSVVHKDTQDIRGMINCVSELVKVESSK